MTIPPTQKPLSPLLPADESERLAALHRYKILDTPPEAAFDRITNLAARLFKMPIALISLVDESRAWFKSCVGFSAREVSRNDSLCRFAVLMDDPLIIPDTREDERFACNPFVQSEPGVRFYAGAPLFSHDGFNLGTLCLLDSQPHDALSAEQQDTLVDLAAMVVDELELRLAAQKIAQVDAALLKVTQGVATVTGEAFLEALVQHFAKVLDVAYVYIGVVAGDNSERLRTIATCAQGQIVENLDYLLQDTPCWEVLEQGKICCYPRNVQAHFPHAPLLKPLSVESYVATPFFDSNGTALGLVGVMDGKPLENRHLAESLLTIFADRVATELERQQTEVALRESEEKYRTLFESIDEGFCSIEVLYDENGQPVDHRILDANPAFEKHTGLTNATGRLASELSPGVEQSWNDLYARVIATGESQRLEQHSPTFSRWFDVEVSRVGDASLRRVAVAFRDISDRKRVDAALRESEEQFRSLANSSPVLIWQTDETGITFVNRYYLEFFAQTLDDLKGMNWANFLHPDDATAYAGAYQTAFERQERYEFQYRFLRHDGEYRWLQNVGEPHYGVDRTFLGFISCFMDVTDIKAAAAISQRAAELDAFRLSLTDALRSIADPIEIQATAARILGESLGVNRVIYIEVISDREEVIVHKNYTDGVAELTGHYRLEDYHRNLTSDHQAGRTQVVTDIPDSSEYTDAEKARYGAIDIAAHLDVPLIKNNQFVALLAVHQAIPRQWTEAEVKQVEETAERTWAAVERARAEAELQQSQEKYRQLFESIDQGFCVCELIVDEAREAYDYRILETNPAFEALTGLKQATGKTGSELIPDLEPFWYETYARVVKTGEPTRFESYLQAWNHWFDVYVTPIGIPQDQQFAVLFSNITGRRRAEAEREQLLQREQTARETAENANRIKDEFLAVLSHELRSPLNPILGWTRLLQKGQLDSDRQAIALETIERNAKLQSQLIEDLLDISRIMQGKLSLTAAPCDLAFVISAAAETVRLAAEAKRIDLQLDLDSAVSPVNGDAARLQQVVWNLLTNAVKFTLEGGHVIVELRQLGQQAQIRVSDTGKGIHPTFLPHVFEYFRQEDGSTTRKFGGLGLGLAIVRQIVEMHGGTVSAVSQGENQGATFMVQLPTVLQSGLVASELTPRSVASKLPLSTLQILVVDDDNDTREFQAFLLEQSGAKVVSVSSGGEALQVLERFTPHVIVSDVGMAEMDGYGLIRLIRSRPHAKGGLIPAIALTAYARDFDQQKALQAGFQKHLTKPVDPDRLISEIVALLETV